MSHCMIPPLCVYIYTHTHTHIYVYIYTHTYTYIYSFLNFFSIIGCRILNIVPCAMQWVLLIYFTYSSVCLLMPRHLLISIGFRYEEFCCLVTQSCPTLCDPVDCSTPGFPVHHQLPELAHTHACRVGVAIRYQNKNYNTPLVLCLIP